MTVTAIAESLHRPRLWRQGGAYEECQVRPCGSAGGLSWVYWNQLFHQPITAAPDLSDCLVVRPKPFRLVIWEPILTKAPGPHLAQAYCCYINKVVFYHRPYRASPFRKFYRRADGSFGINSSPGHFEEWDQLETRLTWDEQLAYEGDIFTVEGGTVIWANEVGKPRRWWMRRSARRIPAGEPA